MNLIGILRMLIFYWRVMKTQGAKKAGAPTARSRHIHRLAGGRHPINHEKLAPLSRYIWVVSAAAAAGFILKINVTIAGQMGNTRVGVFISCMASHYYWKDTDQSKGLLRLLEVLLRLQSPSRVNSSKRCFKNPEQKQNWRSRRTVLRGSRLPCLTPSSGAKNT